MSEWKTYNLGDLLELVIDHRGKTPKKLGFDDFHNTGYPVLSARHVKTSGLINTEQMRFANEEMYKKWMKIPVQKGDVILTSEAPLGELFYIDGSQEYLLGQRVFGLRPKAEVVNPLYLFAWLSSQQGQATLHAKATGSTVQGIKQSELLKIELPLPDLKYQEFVANVLFSLNHKIQLNTQTNQTLEAIAQAIFKSWFVDFDPVRAKAQAILDGKTRDEANLSAMSVISGKAIEELSQTEYQELWQIADAFPSELVENTEFGEVPKGWELTTFGEVAECFDRKRIPLSKKQREEKQGTIPYYGATSIMDYVDEAIFDDIYLLIGEDGSVLKADGTPFIQYIWGKSWVNNHAHVLQGKNGISTEHLMTFIRTENISAYVTGAVQMKLNQANMNKIPFLKANDKVNIYFDYYLKSLYSAFRNNIEENRNLEKTRDLLLPKLLNGELFNE